MDKVLGAEVVDLVILDLKLPDEDGLAIARRLREKLDIPLILLTAGALVSLPLTAVGLPGTWAFLAGVGLWKSFDPAASVSWGAIIDPPPPPS